MDSFASGADVSEVSRLIRECSIDSDGSDFSLNMSINDGYGLNTIQRMEQIEAEVNSLKTNCLAIDQEIHTLHTDIRTSDISSSEEDVNADSVADQLVNLAVDRDSFKGLLNLTVIADETSDSLVQITTESSNSEDEHSSLEWDNEGLDRIDRLASSPCPSTATMRGRSSSPSMFSLQKSFSGCSSAMALLDVQQPSSQAAWNSQESGYLDWDGSCSSATAPTPGDMSSSAMTLSPLLENR